MAVTGLLLIALAAAIVIVADRFYHDPARSVYESVRALRILVVGVFAIVTALIFLGTGMTGFIIAGFLILLYVFAALAFDIDIRDVIGELIP